MTLKDIASLCDIFYIGGTKVGALFGEAVVIPQPGLIRQFDTIVKQRGVLLAKGRLLGLQFDPLFTDGLYLKKTEKSAMLLLSLTMRCRPGLSAANDMPDDS